MKYIRSLTQQRLCLMLAVYIGLFLNGAVLFRRVEGYFEHLTVRNGIFAAIEVFGSVLATFFLLRLLSLFGRRTWANSGLAGGDYLCRRKLLHDVHERRHRVRYRGVGDDHGYRSFKRGGR